jgi:hypothetical protein
MSTRGLKIIQPLENFSTPRQLFISTITSLPNLVNAELDRFIEPIRHAGPLEVFEDFPLLCIECDHHGPAWIGACFRDALDTWLCACLVKPGPVLIEHTGHFRVLGCMLFLHRKIALVFWELAARLIPEQADAAPGMGLLMSVILSVRATLELL